MDISVNEATQPGILKMSLEPHDGAIRIQEPTLPDIAPLLTVTRTWLKWFSQYSSCEPDHDAMLEDATGFKLLQTSRVLSILFEELSDNKLCGKGVVSFAVAIMFTVVGQEASESQADPYGDVVQSLVQRTAAPTAWTADLLRDVAGSLHRLGVIVMQCLILPFKKITSKVPESSGFSTPLSIHSPSEEQAIEGRASTLAKTCRVRDQDRCIVTGAINIHQRRLYHNIPIADDVSFRPLEVCHIIPHAFNDAPAAGPLPKAKVQIWQFLNMMYPGISDALIGSSIDDPCNAITLDSSLHVSFRNLALCFKWVSEENTPHGVFDVYQITTDYPRDFRDYPFNDPVRILRSNISPAPYLLNVHASLSRVSHAMAAAGVFPRQDPNNSDDDSPGVLALNGSDTEVLRARLQMVW